MNLISTIATPDYTSFFLFQIADVRWFVVIRSVSHVAPLHGHHFFHLTIVKRTHKAGTGSSQFGTNTVPTWFAAVFTGENKPLSSMVSCLAAIATPQHHARALPQCVPSSNRPRRLSQIALPSFHILSQGTTTSRTSTSSRPSLSATTTSTPA